MFTVSGKTIKYDVAWTHPDTGVQFPANWLRLTSLAEKEAVGLVEVTTPAAEVYDQRFYWGVGNPKDHAQLQELWISKTKEIAGSLLNQFDWYVVRQAETGKAIPQEVLDYRAAVRTQSDNREVMINGTADTDALAAVITSDFGGMFPWPRGPFEPEPIAADDTILGDAGDDTISFDGGTTSAGIA